MYFLLSSLGLEGNNIDLWFYTSWMFLSLTIWEQFEHIILGKISALKDNLLIPTLGAQ